MAANLDAVKPPHHQPHDDDEPHQRGEGRHSPSEKKGREVKPQPTTSTARESMRNGNAGSTTAAPSMKAKVGTGKAREPRTDTRQNISASPQAHP